MKTKWKVALAVGGIVLLAGAAADINRHFPGGITLSGNSHLYTDSGTELQRDGMPFSPAFTTGVGVTNQANVLSANLAEGANVTFTTNANGQVSIAAAGGGSTIWTNFPAVMDGEGGTIYGSYDLNTLTNGTFAFAVNFLTNNWANPSIAVSIGAFSADPTEVLKQGADVFNFGSFAGNGMIVTNFSGVVFNYGDNAGQASIVDTSFDLYNFGASAGRGSSWINLSTTFNYGDFAGSSNVIDNADEVFNFGGSAGSGVVGSNWFNCVNIGYQAGMNQSFGPAGFTDIFSIGNAANVGLTGNGLSHIFVIGSSGMATNSNDFVFGDSAYNYFFPGGPINASGGYKASGLVGITATYTNEISGVITQRVTITQGIVTGLTTL